jgi:hypothetical protein
MMRDYTVVIYMYLYRDNDLLVLQRKQLCSMRHILCHSSNESVEIEGVLDEILTVTTSPSSSVAPPAYQIRFVR